MQNKTRNETTLNSNNFSTQIFLKVPFCRIVIMRAWASNANVSKNKVRKKKPQNTETETNMNV